MLPLLFKLFFLWFLNPLLQWYFNFDFTIFLFKICDFLFLVLILAFCFSRLRSTFLLVGLLFEVTENLAEEPLIHYKFKYWNERG